MGDTMMRFLSVTPRTVSGVSMGSTARGLERVDFSVRAELVEVFVNPRASSG